MQYANANYLKSIDASNTYLKLSGGTLTGTLHTTSSITLNGGASYINLLLNPLYGVGPVYMGQSEAGDVSFTITGDDQISETSNVRFRIDATNTSNDIGFYAGTGAESLIYRETLKRWDFLDAVTVPTPINATDAVNKNYADTTYLKLSGGAMTGRLSMQNGDINMYASPIYGLAGTWVEFSSTYTVTTLSGQSESWNARFSIESGYSTANIRFASEEGIDTLVYDDPTNTWNFFSAITVPAPINPSDAADKAYVDAAILPLQQRIADLETQIAALQTLVDAL